MIRKGANFHFNLKFIPLMLRSILRNSGIHPQRLMLSIKGWQRYVRTRDEYRRLAGKKSHALPWGKELPMLTEWNEPAGSLGAYFFQDQLVARWIYKANPIRHVDVGSRIDGFIGNLSVFRHVEVIDIRPQPVKVTNVTFHQLNLMDPLKEDWVECTDSLSCLHTIEHFGLGRYADPVDPAGHLRGLDQLKRMVKKSGRLYLSTPIGPERVEFNAHRVFSAKTLLEWFDNNWKIEQFALIDDAGKLHENVDWKSQDAENHFGCQLGLGILTARKEK
jgi:hypothetical protein